MLNFSRFENAHAFEAELAVTADNLRWSQTLDGLFLGSTEHPTVALGTTTAGWAYGGPATFFEPVDGGSNCRVSQPG
jgi:hypothetical protein